MATNRTRRLTDEAVRKLKPPRTGRVEYTDARAARLALRVTSGGAKSWVMRYRYGGRPRRLTLGAFPALSVKRARELADAINEQIAGGVDPAAEKQREKAKAKASAEVTGHDYEPGTFGALAETFIRQKVSTEKRGYEVEAFMRKRMLPKWGHLAIDDVSRHHVVELRDELMDAGKIATAEQAHVIAKRFFNWCVETRGALDASPIASLRFAVKRKARDRVLRDDELRAVWNAAEGLGYPDAPFVRMLILTACRRSEVASMRWPDVDLDKATWTMEADATKSDRAHVVPLSQPAVHILETVERIDDQYVFAAQRKGGSGCNPISHFSKMKRRLDQKAKVEDWRIHDIRRTVATGLSQLGVLPHIRELVLNHAQPMLHQVYNRYDYLAEKRIALDGWAEHLTGAILTGADNVVALKKA